MSGCGTFLFGHVIVDGMGGVMAVLYGAISVIVPVEVLQRQVLGGLAAYEANVPNATFCRDGC